MNFVIELLEFIRFDTVMIVINSVSKRTYFIPIHMTVTIKDTVGLFYIISENYIAYLHI